MGYRSVLRSVRASARKANIAAERDHNRRMRESVRLNKKMAAVADKRDTIFEALQQEYASGKISQEQFKQLKEREPEIGLELIALAHGAGIALGKRYLCGKIERDEFEKIKREIIPSQYFEEQNLILSDYESRRTKITDFKSQCVPEREGFCQKCGAEKRFFRWMYEYENFSLCRKCKNTLEGLERYPGFSGQYLMTNPGRVESGSKLQASIKPEHFS